MCKRTDYDKNHNGYPDKINKAVFKQNSDGEYKLVKMGLHKIEEKDEALFSPMTELNSKSGTDRIQEMIDVIADDVKKRFSNLESLRMVVEHPAKPKI